MQISDAHRVYPGTRPSAGYRWIRLVFGWVALQFGQLTLLPVAVTT